MNIHLVFFFSIHLLHLADTLIQSSLQHTYLILREKECHFLAIGNWQHGPHLLHLPDFTDWVLFPHILFTQCCMCFMWFSSSVEYSVKTLHSYPQWRTILFPMENNMIILSIFFSSVEKVSELWFSPPSAVVILNKVQSWYYVWVVSVLV